MGFQGGASGKEPTYQSRRPRFNPWVGKILWRRAWLLPTPVFLPGNPHGQRSLAGYSPWGLKELNTTATVGYSAKEEVGGGEKQEWDLWDVNWGAG